MSKAVNNISFTLADIAKEAEKSVCECYGVVDLSSVSSKNSSLGAVAKKTKNGYEIDLYLFLSFGVRITEVAVEIRKKVKYDLERKFKVRFNTINVYIQGIKNL